MAQHSAVASRIETAAHSNNRMVNTDVGQIVIDDRRLRNWLLAATGGLSTAYDVDTKLSGGYFVRARTISGNKIEVARSVPSASMTWTVTFNSETSPLGQGVALCVNGSSVDVFWMRDSTHLYTANSSNYGATFGSASLVATLSAQIAGSFVRMDAPVRNLVFFTSSLAATGTTIYYCKKVSGTWQTPVAWDLNTQVMGVEAALSIPGDTTRTSTLGVVQTSPLVNTGLTNGGTFADDASGGTDPWINPGNAKYLDTVYAQITNLGGAGSQSHYLKITNFGFSIPTYAQIMGIEVTVNGYHAGATWVSIGAKLVKGGSITGSTNTIGNLNNTPTTSTMGSNSNLWGLTWTPADINASNFGVALFANYLSFVGDIGYIDYVGITVYYITEPNRYLLTSYLSQPRNEFDKGVYTLALSQTDTTPDHWQSINPVFATNSLTNSLVGMATIPELWCAFPKMMWVGSEIWILALEMSNFAGVNVVHYGYFKSSDGIHFSDRNPNENYLAGTDLTYLNGTTPTNFVVSDFVYASLLVSGNYVYLVGYDRVFQAPASSVVGVDNPSMILDVTPHTTDDRLSEAGTGQASIGTTNLLNPASSHGHFLLNEDGSYLLQEDGSRILLEGFETRLYDGSTILRAGSRLIRKGGYKTTSGLELVTMSTEIIDEVRQKKALGQNTLSITSRDYIKKLIDWLADIYFEYQSATRLVLTEWADQTKLNVLNGGFTVSGTSPNQVLQGDIIDVPDQYQDNLAFLAIQRTKDGILERYFENYGANWTGVYCGIAFQGVDNLNYYAILYNYADNGKFKLYQSAPSVAGSTKFNTYTAVTGSGTYETSVALSATTYYWFRVTQHHNRVVAEYSTDRQTWTTVIDFVGVPCNAAYWGIISSGNVEAQERVGQTTHFGLTEWNDPNPANNGKRFDYAMQVTPSYDGIVDAISIYIEQGYRLLAGADPNGFPSIVASVTLDNGLGTKPANLSIASNTLDSVAIPQDSIISATGAWQEFFLKAGLPIVANKKYWIWGHPTHDIPLTAGNWDWNSGYAGYNDTGDGTYPSLYLYDNTSLNANPNWITIGTNLFPTHPNASLNFALYARLQKKGIRDAQLLFSSGEMDKSIEFIANEIGVKSGIMNFASDDATIGVDVMTDLIYEGDAYFDNNVTSFLAFTFAWNTGGGVGYGMQVAPNPDLVQFFINGVLQTTSPCLVPLPIGELFHVTLGQHGGFISLYINDILCACFYDVTYQSGIASASILDGTWTNARIADISNIKNYFAIESEKDGRSALERLFQKGRIKYFALYNGTLYISRFAKRTNQDTYTTTLLSQDVLSTDRYWFSHLRPSGADGLHYADRFDPTNLDEHGRRFKVASFTDAFSDAQAYQDALIPLREAREMSDTSQIVTGAVPTSEREDLITVVDPETAVSTQWIINDKTTTRSFPKDPGDKPVFDQTAGLRKYTGDT